MDKSPLLADSQALTLESLTSKDAQVVLIVKSVQAVVPCPRCHQPSSRVHSHYQRTVTDLPWQGVTVQLQLLTRRFFCVDKTCVRRIFCERLPQVAAAYGRQTVRLPDRERSTLKTWLSAHPGVEIVTRDRLNCIRERHSAGSTDSYPSGRSVSSAAEPS